MKVAENLFIRFFLEKKEKTKDGKMPIYIELSVTGSKQKEFSTGMKTLPKLWNQSTWRVEEKTPEILGINNRLTQIKASLEKHYLLLTTQYEYVVNTSDLSGHFTN